MLVRQQTNQLTQQARHVRTERRSVHERCRCCGRGHSHPFRIEPDAAPVWLIVSPSPSSGGSSPRPAPNCPSSPSAAITASSPTGTHGSATIDHIKVATARDPDSPGDFISQTNDETAGQTLATQQVSSHPAPQKIHECSRELATACNQAGHDVVDGPREKRAAR